MGSVFLSRAPVAHDERARNRQAAALALLAFAMLTTSLDQYLVVVALPSIGRELGFTDQTLQWVISANAVTSAGFLLLGGRAADLLGRRRIFVTGLALYGGASLAGGLAPTPELLLGARAVQGLGGALVFPATLSLVNTTLPRAASAIGRWRSGVERARPASCSACCSAASERARSAGKRPSSSTCRWPAWLRCWRSR
jgi:MFS family permease